MIANATVGIAGAIWSGTNISAHATPVGALVDALGALLVGELAIRFLYRRNISSSPLAGVVACGLGAILYAFARILAYKVAKGTFADMQAQDQKLLVGLIILVIVLLIPKSESRGESRVL
jgi:hypothetical protein